MAETAGLHLRETRAHAREIKFVVDAARGPEIQAWMRANLAHDEFGSGPEHDQFETSSLYFETGQFDVFHRRGSYGKSKYRVRRYGTSPIMFLERKFRTERVLIKRRTTAALEDFRRIELHEPDPEWYGYWFHRRLLARRLKPLVQVSYVRTARLGSSPSTPPRRRPTSPWSRGTPSLAGATIAARSGAATSSRIGSSAKSPSDSLSGPTR